MSEITQTNNINSPKLPKVGLFVIGQQKIEQNYNNLSIIRLEGICADKYDNNFAQTFNNENHRQFDLYGYLLPYHQFTTEDAIPIIVNKLSQHQMFIGTYTDTTTGFYPSYHPATIHNNIIINTPIFSKQPLQFNTNLQHLIFMDILRQQTQQALWLHIAEPLIEITSSNINYEQDLKELQNETSI